jgi:hypothetical protein
MRGGDTDPSEKLVDVSMMVRYTLCELVEFFHKPTNLIGVIYPLHSQNSGQIHGLRMCNTDKRLLKTGKPAAVVP